jgi:hypothetical protein
MTVAAVSGQAGGVPWTNAPSVTRAFPSNVAAGNLVTVIACKWSNNAAGDAFVGGDCSQSAGTAVLTGLRLELQVQMLSSGYGWAVGIWTGIVQSGGSCTMQVAGGLTDTYGILGTGEFSTTAAWGSDRLEDSASATGTSTTPSSGAMDAAGIGLFIGGVVIDDFSGHALTQDPLWTLIHEDEDPSDAVLGSIIYRIVTGATTDDASWTQALSRAWQAAGIVLRESSSGITGTSAATEGADTGSASGNLEYIGTSTPTEANDTSSAQGGMNVSGTAAPTEADDTSNAIGSIGAAISGTSAATEGGDTSAAAGLAVNAGASAAVEGADAAAITGDVIGIQVPVFDEVDDEVLDETYREYFGTPAVQLVAMLSATGTAAPTEGNDTSTAAGTVGTSAIIGTAAPVEAADTGSAGGFLEVIGAVAAVEANDTGAASGALGGSEVFGTVAVVEADDVGAAAGSLFYTSTMAAIEVGDIMFALGINGTVSSSGAGVLMKLRRSGVR